MNELQKFTAEEFGTIRGMTVDGEPWLVGKDVAEALGYSNPRDAISKHVDAEDKNTVAIRDGTSGNPNAAIINESGLYSLIFGSKLPNAQKFKRWVTSDVLPTIRKTGGYLGNTENMSDFELVSRALLIVQKQLEQRDETIRKIAPDAEYARNCLRAENGIVTSSIAKEYGMSAAAFNKMLNGFRIQYKRGGQWLLYAPYQDKCYMVPQTVPIEHSDGRVDQKVISLWTAEGRKFLYDALKTRGVFPLSEKRRKEARNEADKS